MGARKKSEGEASGGNLIQLMIVSLFIILLAFFILLNSMAKESEEKKMMALESLKRNLSSGPGGYALFRPTKSDTGIDMLMATQNVVDLSDLTIGDPQLIKNIQFVPLQRGSLVRIPANKLFHSKSLKLKPVGYMLLDKLSGVIRKSDCPVDITGHTDISPIDENNAVSNREFSVIRVFNVLDYLVTKGNIDSKRLTAFGWGPYRRVYTYKTSQARNYNERIDLLFVHKKKVKKPKGVFNFKDFFFNPLES